MSKLVLVNLLTGSRLALAVPVAVLTLWSRDRSWAIVASTILIIAIEVSDLADGYAARRSRTVSKFGKLFDPYADSVSRLVVYWSLAMIGRCLAFVPLVMAVRDVTVSYSRIVMTERGGDVSARRTGKLKALVQGTCGAVLMAGPLYWGRWEQTFVIGLSSAVVAITVLSMLDYGRAALRAL
ncbi:MAG: CDP-alcohol phosphatidyltransferase family protein [Candidatus Brocadiaceae bacterium]|nr:CDP-alcohol phosphatidyltransferase family protein [Candidatus Brocadiaceae bacterium]